MIIKSMSRKSPSFDQLIDYIESEQKLKSRHFSLYHNVYTRNSDELKTEFKNNAHYLKFRKNGVYLYHEVISITRAKHLAENEQKALLKNIVSEYLHIRAKNNLAYAVLHEDKKDNLHFHIVISANEAEDSTRKRLSKADFADIQIRLEKWTLEHHPELEQKAVFFQNQTEAEKEERASKAHISNKGREQQRRTGHTPKRDDIKTTLQSIFKDSTDGQHFTEKLNTAGFTMYQRGKQYGIIDQNGTKYRFSTLGLTEQWEDLDRRMTENLQQSKQKQENKKHTHQQSTFKDSGHDTKHQPTPERQTQKAEVKEEPSKQEKQPSEQKNDQQTQHRSETTDQMNADPNPFIAIKEFFSSPKEIKEELQEIDQAHPDSKAEADPREEEIKRRLAEIEAIRQERANNEASTSNKNQAS
jgi:hypothetical protein